MRVTEPLANVSEGEVGELDPEYLPVKAKGVPSASVPENTEPAGTFTGNVAPTVDSPSIKTPLSRNSPPYRFSLLVVAVCSESPITPPETFATDVFCTPIELASRPPEI